MPKFKARRKKRRKYKGRVGCLGQARRVAAALAWRPTAGNQRPAKAKHRPPASMEPTKGL
jgi:hypothetical protein